MTEVRSESVDRAVESAVEEISVQVDRLLGALVDAGADARARTLPQLLEVAGQLGRIADQVEAERTA